MIALLDRNIKMDNEMIERVAKSMFCELSSNYNPSKGWDELLKMSQPSLVIRHYMRLAKAAIVKAMREPTEKMLEPVTNADGFFKLDDPKQAWYKMIDVIINE